MKVLLGRNKNNELVFANFSNDETFRCSFDIVKPILIDDDILEDEVQCLLDGMDKETLFDMCVDFDCRPSELAEEYVSEHDISEIIDISLYPNSFILDDNKHEYYFESVSCGQCESVRADKLEEYTNKGFFDFIVDIWFNYHLEKLPTELSNKLDEWVGIMKYFNEEKWVEDFLYRYDD